MPRPRDYHSKTAPTFWSPEHRFFARKTIAKPFASCAAICPDNALSCYYGFSFLSRFGHHFVGLRNAHDFFDGRLALRHTSPAVLPQSFHAFGDSTLLELAAIALLHDQLSQRFSHQANFVNCGAPLVAGLAALIAASAAPEAGAEFFHRKADLGEVFARIVDPLHAVWTNRAHESLRDERLDHRSEQKRLHIHIEQARDAADGIIRVQRAENKMTRHRRADRDVRRFDVANLTNHHNVRVLPQNVTETFGKGQIDLRLNVDLGHARQPIFHRLFDGDDAPLNGIDAAQEAIKRRRFSAASRAGEKKDSVRLREQIANDLVHEFYDGSFGIVGV